MKLHNLLPPYGKKHKEKRVGRGDSSGKGNYSGRGLTGEGSRAGRVHYLGFEGGQMPLYRRLPKRGFSPLNREEYQEVNLGSLNLLKSEKEVTPELLYKKGLVKKIDEKIKILGKGILERAIIVKAHKFSAKAKEEITSKGGQAIEIKLYLSEDISSDEKSFSEKPMVKEPVAKNDDITQKETKPVKSEKKSKVVKRKKSLKTKGKTKTTGKKKSK